MPFADAPFPSVAAGDLSLRALFCSGDRPDDETELVFRRLRAGGSHLLSDLRRLCPLSRSRLRLRLLDKLRRRSDDASVLRLRRRSSRVERPLTISTPLLDLSSGELEGDLLRPPPLCLFLRLVPDGGDLERDLEGEYDRLLRIGGVLLRLEERE